MRAETVAIHCNPKSHKIIQTSNNTLWKMGDTSLALYYTISAALVILGGAFAGLTLALMGQDEVHLTVVQSTGTPAEKKWARSVLNLTSKGKHWVLVTLLLANVITNESLPIVLDRCLGGGWQAVVSSTALIVVFGEVIPQSICVKHGLRVGAFFAPLVELLMYALWPLAYPVARLLDHLLGEDHGTVYRKSGLKSLVTLHGTRGTERLTRDEITIISAVLDLKDKRVGAIMTPIDHVFTLPADKVLDTEAVQELFNSGFSRIPICLPDEPLNFIGMLLVRVLIAYDPADCLPVSHFPLATLPETSPDTSCLNILNYFQEGKSHMCIVSADPGSAQGAVGVITLEDVIEELIGEEIVDESDVFVDIHQHIARQQPGPLSLRHVTSHLHHLYTTSSKQRRYSATEQTSNTGTAAQEESVGAAGLENESTPLVGNATTGYKSVAPSRRALSQSVMVPSNLASNPRKTDKPFVVIKNPIDAVAAVSNATRRKSTQSEDQEEALHAKVLDTHSKLSSRALEHTERSGQATNVTSKVNSIDIRKPDYSRNIGHLENNSSNGTGSEGMMISSSFQPTMNGIVESIITVKGVPKTIIQPADDWDDSIQHVDGHEKPQIEHSITSKSASTGNINDRHV